MLLFRLRYHCVYDYLAGYSYRL